MNLIQLLIYQYAESHSPLLLYHYRKLFIDLVGKSYYINFKTMMNMVGNLESGKTRLTIVPKDSQIFLGHQGGIPLPASAK